MKQIGLIGGMSWESTSVYYSLINNLIKENLGGVHSAKIILDSVDYDYYTELQTAEDWTRIASELTSKSKSLEEYGAKCIAICCNTMHIVSNQITTNIKIPFIHIARATATEIQRSNVKRVLLLGTKFTMEKDFFKEILLENNIETIIPDQSDKTFVHDAIYKEFCKGIFNQSTKNEIIKIINKHKNIEGVILGCTELPMLIKPEDLDIKSFDTTLIHCKELVDFMLE